MKPPIPTPEPVPVQTLRRYGLNATADEVAEVYRQHGELLQALHGFVEYYGAYNPITDKRIEPYAREAQDAIARATATQKKG